MTEPRDPQRWKDLGRHLVRARIELDARYSNLTTFAEERGLEYRLAWDIENGRRNNYRRSTIAAIEVAYELDPDSVAAFVEGRVDSVAPQRLRPSPDGRPRYADPEEQHVADTAWDNNAYYEKDPELRAAFAEIAVRMYRQNRGKRVPGEERRRA
jgi:hypothetical protein